MASPKAGEKVAVIGLGPIGLLSARLFQLAGADVLGVDQRSARVDAAIAGGLNAQLAESTPADAVQVHFPDGADIVVDATGSPKVLPLSLEAARRKPWDDPSVPGPKLVVQGSYPAEFSLDYERAFQRELTILFPRDAMATDRLETIRLVDEGKLKVDDLATAVFEPREAQAVYDSLLAGSAMTALFKWNS
jgi:threonine dehydrogenase-like Zn-dependent dehydrogenase